MVRHSMHCFPPQASEEPFSCLSEPSSVHPGSCRLRKQCTRGRPRELTFPPRFGAQRWHWRWWCCAAWCCSAACCALSTATLPPALHSLASSPRRVAEWLVLHYPEAVRAVRALASHPRPVATCHSLALSLHGTDVESRGTCCSALRRCRQPVDERPKSRLPAQPGRSAFTAQTPC